MDTTLEKKCPIIVVNNSNSSTSSSGSEEGNDQNSETSKNTNNTSIVRRNPSILLALDTVHRSLLLKNLQFDQESSYSGGETCSTRGSSTCEEELQQRAIQEHPLDNILAQPRETQVVKVTGAGSDQVDCPKQFTKPVDALETLIKQTTDGTFSRIEGLELVKRQDRDFNNNNNNKNNDSRVMMMVAKYESQRGKAVEGTRVDDTETSDFETASVSSSSLGSLRSSSAFSEGSRDVMSVENLGKPELTNGVTQAECHRVKAGTSTMITINIINKTADNGCDRTSLGTNPQTKAVHVQVPEESETEPTTASSVDDMSSKSEPVEEQQKFDAAEVFSDQSLYDTLQFQTAESQDFLDCGDDVVSSNSGYDESSTEDSDISVQVPKQTQHSKVINQEVIDSDSAPMINIIQEVTPNMQVTSTVILNKAKIKEHRKARAADKKQKQKKEKKKMDNSIFNRQKIIDDNFCNEILDSTIHFDRLYGLNRKTAVETPIEVLSDSAIQPSSAGDESFDSSLSFGKLEGKPRYSGRPVGRLMARRLKKLDKPPKQNKSEGLSDSSASNYANGPKKPPRTFASQSKSRIGWVLEKKGSSSGKQSSSEKPSCPKLEDLDSDPDLAGWNFSKKEKSHEMGWTVPKERTNNSAIPPHIYSMLHYSDDETKKRLIKSSKSKAAPQASLSKHQLEQALLGPKLDIDTVDSGCSEAAPVQRRSSSNLEFEAFVANSKIKSTPHKHKQQQVSRRTDLFLKSERKQNFEDRRRTTGNISDREQEFAHFLDNGRRSDHDPNQEIFCRKCTEKSQSKKSFRKAAVRRTKSFFEASKKKIHLQGLKKKAKKDHFETPKKCELGSNLNKENSVKKQLHKHLGYTPDHLRCGSCPKQSGMVHNNLTPEIKSAPARINERHPSNRLPTRTVLNFSGPDMVDSVDGDGAETQKKQKSHEIKFLKTLKNLKISPKKIFKSHDESGKHQCTSTSSPRQYGNFQSYDDLNLDNVAQMGDFLNNVRRAVEVERQTTCRDEALVREAASISRNRRISTSSELLDSSAMERLRRLRAAVDSPPEEPIYQEISPKNNKTIINEFISGESSGNHRYLMVNNNPNVLYATVNKTAKNLIKTKSSNNVCEDQPQPISVKKLNSEPPTSPCPQQSNASIETQSNSATGRRLRRSLFRTPTACDDTVGGGAAPTRSGFADEDNDISVLQEDDDDDHRKDQHLCTDDGNRQRQGVVVDEVVVIRQHVGKMGTSPNKRCTTDSAVMRDDDDAYRLFSGDIHRTNSGTMIRQGVATTREEVFEMLRSGTTTVGRAPLGSIDTDDEIESLQKYEDRGLDELRKSLRDNISISEIGTNDTESEAFVTGYDTVDFFGAITPARRNNLEAGSDRRAMDSTIDTDNISELMSAHDYSISNISPVNSSPSSAKLRLNSSDVYRNLKDKLRNSFRKSKNFIKNEQRKIVNYFDEKPAKPEESGNRVVFNLDEYCKKYGDDADAEEIYQSLSNAGSLIELSNQFLAELVNQIKTQTDIRKQLKQALAICRNTREFECSSELIEAERLMLLSTLKENAARNELSKIDYNANGKILNDGKKVGIVALNHFEYPLKETAVNDMLFNYFYVVVCSYKNQVKATLAKERYKDRVYFRNCEIEFHDLDAEYEIRVEVFVLRLRKNARNFSFESKYHLNKESKNFLGSCPSPPKLRSPAKLLSSRSNSPKNFDFDNEFSRFKSQGFITLTSFSLLPGNSTLQMEGNEQLLENCRHSPYYSASSNFQRMVRRQGDHNIYLMEDFKYLKLDSMVYNSNLLGSIGMSVKSEVLFVNSDIDGFINVGQSRTGTVDWSRKWCKLNGFVLEFWNYPQECQEKLPTLQIDLTKCINDGVELADRTSCSRPRTFRLDIFAKGTGSCSSSGISSYKDTDSHQHNRNSDSHHSQQAQQQQQQQSLCDNTKTYLLSVDTPNELKTWLNELNRVVKFLKEWKI